jgi:hypothetical protein
VPKIVIEFGYIAQYVGRIVTVISFVEDRCLSPEKHTLGDRFVLILAEERAAGSHSDRYAG